jgi:hypothetical protein
MTLCLAETSFNRLSGLSFYLRNVAEPQFTKEHD